MTYRELLLQAEERLEESHISEAKNDAWLLFEHIFKMARHKYFMVMNDLCADTVLADEYMKCVLKRSNHVPLQHITGVQDFMGLTFHVNENVLIPRQDTEILVEQALKHIKEISHKQPVSDINVLDMCTGSGCIAISIAKLGNVKVTAVDISDEALKVAEENAKYNRVGRVRFIKSNLFENLRNNNTGNICEKYDIIVSNPPYIPSQVIEGLMPEVRDFEPRQALDGTEDGLEFYRRITEESLKYIKDSGWLMYEIGCEQGDDVKLIMEHNGYEDVCVIKDLAGLDRVVIGQNHEVILRDNV